LRPGAAWAPGLLLLGALGATAGSPGAPTPADYEIALFRERAQRDPDDYVSPTRLAAACLRKARESGEDSWVGEAEVAARRALAIKPDLAGARLQLAGALAAQHRFQEAIREGEAARAAAPDEPSADALLADAWLGYGDLARAEREIGRLEGRAPAFHVLTRRANLLAARGRHAEALAALGEALAAGEGRVASEDQAWLLLRRAEILAATGRWEEAEQDLASAERLAPGSRQVRVQLAALRADQGRLEEAIALREAIVAEQPHPEHLEALAVVLARAGRTQHAEAVLERARAAYAAALASGGSHDLRHAARFYAELSPDPPLAVRCARRDLELRQDAGAWDALAWAQLAAGDGRGAAESAARALASGVRSADVFYHAGRIRLALGDVEGGRKHLREVLAVNPRDLRGAEIRELLGEPGPGPPASR
jgi:tetratricopeptide (TPR) repeat protein